MPGPYSDNLYSAVDSEPEDDDTTTHDDALSPTDGYFHAQDTSPSRTHETPYVPNVLVEDPSLRQQAKEEEARYNNARPDERSPWDHRRGVEDDGSMVLGSTSAQASSSRPALQHIPSDAPPAYSPRSPTSPTSPQSGVGYQTFPSSSPQAHSMGVPDEQNRLLPREPESMGGDPALQRPGLSRWEEWREAKWGTTRRKVRTVLSTLLILAIVASLLGGLFSLGADGSNDKMKNPGSKDPAHGPSTSPGDLKWNHIKQCHAVPDPVHRYQSTANLAFVPTNNISIYQKIDDNDHVPSGRTPHISGNVVLRPVDAKSAGRVELEALSNHRDLSMKVDTNQLEQTLILRTPRTVEWHEAGDPCIQIRVTIYVPSGSNLDSLTIEVVHLGIDILSALNLTLDNKAFLASLSGGVTAPSGSDISYTLSSREIWVETVSGDITGFYPLHDLLGLHTISGTINTGVSPKAVDTSDPKPARLDVASVSGDLNVKEPADDIPARDYVVKFDTTSGTIDSEVAVSSEGRFSSRSASFKLKVQPVLEKGQAMKLDTETKSGSTHLELLEPTWVKLPKHKNLQDELPDDEEGDDPFLIIHPHSSTHPFDHLSSHHSSISGTIQLRYPSSWTGQFEAESISGSQKFRGEGLRTGTKTGLMFPRVLRGRKGEGDGVLRVNSVSGAQDFLVGRE